VRRGLATLVAAACAALVVALPAGAADARADAPALEAGPAAEPSAAAPFPAGAVPAEASAAPTTADAASPTSRELRDWYVLGGWIMHGLVLCSVLVVAIGLERGVALRRGRVAPRALLREVRARLAERDLPGVQQACEARPGVLAELLHLAARHRVRGDVERMHLESAGTAAVTRLSRNLALLAALANLATLLGLLGTVLGMLEAFERIAVVGTSDARVVASGIFAALVTTAGGLSVAIVALSLHAFFRRRVEGYAAELEDAVAEVAEGAEARAARGRAPEGGLAGAEA